MKQSLHRAITRKQPVFFFGKLEMIFNVILPRRIITEKIIKKELQMDIEIVIAELMKLFHVENITPSQYAEVVKILLKLEVPKDIKI